MSQTLQYFIFKGNNNIFYFTWAFSNERISVSGVLRTPDRKSQRQLKTEMLTSTKKPCYLFLFLLEEGCIESQLRAKNILSVQTCQAFVNSKMVNKRKAYWLKMMNLNLTQLSTPEFWYWESVLCEIFMKERKKMKSCR